VWREAEDARQRMEDLAAQIAKDEAEQKARAAEKRRLKEEEMTKRRESMSCSASVSSSELSSEKQQSRRASAMQHVLHSTGASPMTTSGSFAHLGSAFNNGEASEGWDLLMVEESHSQVTKSSSRSRQSALPRPRSACLRASYPNARARAHTQFVMSHFPARTRNLRCLTFQSGPTVGISRIQTRPGFLLRSINCRSRPSGCAYLPPPCWTIQLETRVVDLRV
jgi:hypothetical protein